MRETITATAVTGLTLLVPSAQAAPAEPGKTATGGAVRECDITRYGYKGKYICGTHVEDEAWGQNKPETFIASVNHKLYHTWRGANGWHSMGGWTKDARIAGARTVITVGGDNREWCWDDGNQGVWRGPYRC